MASYGAAAKGMEISISRAVQATTQSALANNPRVLMCCWDVASFDPLIGVSERDGEFDLHLHDVSSLGDDRDYDSLGCVAEACCCAKASVHSAIVC